MDSAISFGEPGTQLVRDSRGNIFGGSLQGGQVLKWGPDGTLIAAIGSPGDGPGELGFGGVSTFVVADSLYVRDGHLHWVVYDPALRFVRYAETGPIAAYGRYDTHFLPNDLLLSTHQTSPLAGFSVAILDRNGRVLRQFAEIPQTVEQWQPRPRASIYVGEGRIWLAPVAGPRDGYRIEIWDTAGRLVDSIVRGVDWFRPKPGYEANYRENTQGRPFPFPSLSLLWSDSTGMVWAVSTLPKGPGSEGALRNASMQDYRNVFDSVMELNIDVFDAATKQLVAAGRFPATQGFMADPLYSDRWISRISEDSLGFRTTALVQLTLRDSAGRRCIGSRAR